MSDLDKEKIIAIQNLLTIFKYEKIQTGKFGSATVIYGEKTGMEIQIKFTENNLEIKTWPKALKRKKT
jgi:hypothetical protein